MKKVIYVLVFFYVTLQFLVTNSPILLNAQPGWSDDRRLVEGFVDCWDPRAACWGDTIHLVWWQHYAYDEVFYKRSTDKGEAWGDNARLTSEDEISAVTPCIAAWGNNIHVVWDEQTAYYSAICYRKSENGGDTWGDTDTIWQTSMDGWYHPWIAVNRNNVFLTAVKSGGGGLFFVKSTDNGNSWSSQQSITYAVSNPCIEDSKLDSLFLAIVYFNGSEISIVLSFDAGESWSDTQVVSEDDGIASQRPAFDIDETDGLHVSWYDYKYSPYAWTGDIFYRASRDSGNTWEDIDSLTVVHRATVSHILAEGNNLHLVWTDDRHEFSENREIYYRMSRDLGHNWDPEVRLTDAPYHSMRPSLACGGGYLHLFWHDRRDYGNSGAGPLYYKRKDLSYSIEESNKSTIADYRLHVYPNPFSQMLNIKYMHAKGGAEIRIFDVYGREMAECLTKDQPDGLTVVTRDLPCGVYFVQVFVNNQRVMKKVVKIR